MKGFLYVCLGMTLFVCSGCSTLGPTAEQSAAMLDAYKAYSSQQRMGNIIKVHGDATHPATVSITGLDVEVATPLPPLQVLPPTGDRQFDMIEHIATEASRLGMFGAAAYLLKDSIGGETHNHYQAEGTTP